MNANDTSTAAERLALNKARKLLGNNLAEFLLSGLGETSVTHRRTFSAQNSPPLGDEVTYQLEMINDSEPGLPMGRDPLVLAALLDLLWKHQTLNDTIRFQESEIIEGLGWPQSSESNSGVNEAIKRYLHTAFCLVDPTINEEERVFGRYARYRRLLVGYEITMVGMRITSDRRQIQLMFLPEFIECLVSDAKRFLGVEFQNLRGIRSIDS